MNRKTAEKLIAKLLRAIVDILIAYDPEADYLTLCYMKRKGGSSSIFFDNCSHSARCPVDYREEL